MIQRENHRDRDIAQKGGGSARLRGKIGEKGGIGLVVLQVLQTEVVAAIGVDHGRGPAGIWERMKQHVIETGS